MTVKGFKFKRFDYVGGATTESYDWGSSSTPLSRSQGVIKDFGNWILSDSDLHWELDPSRHPNYDSSIGIQTSDLANVSVKNPGGSMLSDRYSPGLYFINSESGCKLFLAIVSQYVMNIDVVT